MDPAKQEVDMQRRRIIASCHNTPQTVTLLSMEKIQLFIPVDSKFRRAHAARRICQNEMIFFWFFPVQIDSIGTVIVKIKKKEYHWTYKYKSIKKLLINWKKIF